MASTWVLLGNLSYTHIIKLDWKTHICRVTAASGFHPIGERNLSCLQKIHSETTSYTEQRVSARKLEFLTVLLQVPEIHQLRIPSVQQISRPARRTVLVLQWMHTSITAISGTAHEFHGKGSSLAYDTCNYPLFPK